VDRFQVLLDPVRTDVAGGRPGQASDPEQKKSPTTEGVVREAAEEKRKSKEDQKDQPRHSFSEYPGSVHNRAVSDEKPRFRLLGPEDDKDRLELHLPQEKLDLIEKMLREVVPKYARYAWFIDAEGWPYAFEGEPPSDRTYLMRCLAAGLCTEGESASGMRTHPTPNLAPFEIRLHVQTLGPGKPQAVLISQPHDKADLAQMDQVIAGIRPRLEEMVVAGLWIVPPGMKTSEEFGLNARRPPRA